MPKPNTQPRPRTIAAVLAGGTGSRMGAPLPKQFIEVGGKPILQHTLEAFEAAPEIDTVIVVTAAPHRERVRALALACAPKVADVIDGGATRSDSSRAAIDWATARTDAHTRLLLHDAARMLVPNQVITDVVHALDHCEAVTAAVPSSDTVIETADSTAGDIIAASLDRSRLRRVQTPQGFHLGTIADAYARAASDPAFTPTDDCSVVLRFLPDVPVRVVGGSERNLKVTTPIDLVVAEALLADRR
ncbi:2-C-methyl-D-erythritol 4-phosphate cytidylyltransferase [Glycomyces sp. YM15]|uniref:2-C-methyl-D-erythritol 4-phosphate cytidylyltransferase n=1 Tax=Glycomyces sp. YM15 TaxID=2800446 RepID=UPI0019648BDC|nr:2-C-methyl-D-erythritol 4-phosphate cytidylyltransferase [Glycomyces sp. YM15]